MRNIKQEEVKELAKKCTFVPNRNFLAITVNTYGAESEIDIVTDQEDDINIWQYVIAAGPQSDYKPGDKVMINIERLIKRIANPKNKMEVMEVLNIIKLDLDDESYGMVDDTAILGKVKS